MKEKMRLGDLLLEKKIVTENDIQMALEHLKVHGGKLGQALVALEIITEDKLLAALRHHLNIPSVDLKDKEVPEEIIKMLPGDVAKKYIALPVKRDDSSGKRRLFVAMSDPIDLAAIEEMQFVTGMRIVPVLCKESEILPAVERYYGEVAKGEVTDDLTAWMKERSQRGKKSDQDKWLNDAVSRGKPGEPRTLEKSHFETLKNERMVLRALVNLIIRFDIFSVEEIEAEIKRVEREFHI
jgi:hypothetical protein